MYELDIFIEDKICHQRQRTLFTGADVQHDHDDPLHLLGVERLTECVHAVEDQFACRRCQDIGLLEKVEEADAVYVDFPVQIALECRMCHRCEQELPCPVEIENASIEWVNSRTINIIGAWHNQLLEVMGAMGIRDVRRLRGEVGRAIFYEDIDEAIFGSMRSLEEGFELE